MKKTFLNKLPRWKKGVNKDKINWKESVGYIVKFIYDNVEGEVEIINYYKKNNYFYLDIQYKNNIYTILRKMFESGHLGIILEFYTKKYKYNVNNVVKTKLSKLKILEQIRIGKNNNKGYRYKCLNCGNEDTILEYQLKNGSGCNVCYNSHTKTLKGYNDMWTTNPELAKLLVDPNDGYKYSEYSNQKIDWNCPICGTTIKNKPIDKINTRGLSCPKCGDGFSYPEKIMYQILQNLNIKFEYQYKPDWCIYKLNNKNKTGRYDFYFELNNQKYIIEMDGGLGHGYNDNKMNGQSKEESKLIDDIKDRLANEHNIKVIRIDCKKSELEYIKKHIIDSELNNLFDLSNIDWLECEKFACSSLVKKICDLWNSGIHDSKKIRQITKLSKSTINKYLKKGTKIGWCNYNPKEPKIDFGKKYGGQNKQKVICLNNSKIFSSIKGASIYYDIATPSNISMCCNSKRNYSGVNLITGEYLQWQYYDEYLIKPKNLLSNKEIDKMSKTSKKKIICLNNKKIFDSISDAIKYYNFKSYSSIILCCQGKQKSAGKHPITKEKLRWMYYEDYLQEK